MQFNQLHISLRTPSTLMSRTLSGLLDKNPCKEIAVSMLTNSYGSQSMCETPHKEVIGFEGLRIISVWFLHQTFHLPDVANKSTFMVKVKQDFINNNIALRGLRLFNSRCNPINHSQKELF